MPYEREQEDVPEGHRNQLWYMGLQGLIALLLGILTYTARDLANDNEKLFSRVGTMEITAEGTKHRLGFLEQRQGQLEQKIEGMVMMSERTWNELSDYRREKRRQYAK